MYESSWLAPSVASSLVATLPVSSFTADAKAGVDLDQIEQIIDEELTRLFTEGPTQEELQRTKFSTTAAFVRQAEKVGGFGGKSDILASGAVYHDNLVFISRKWSGSNRQPQPIFRPPANAG